MIIIISGEIMQRVFIALLSCLLFMPFVSFAGEFKITQGGDCAVWKRDMAKNQFWFCLDKDGNGKGETGDKCEGIEVKKASIVTSLQDGQVKEDINVANGDRYTLLCCNGKLQYHKGDKENEPDKFTETTRTKTLTGGGTCQQTLDVCGNLKEDCDTVTEEGKCPTSLNGKGDMLWRNGECVEPCVPPMAFESATSNKCVKCENGELQGINDNNACEHCVAGDEFFVPSQRACVKRSTMIAYSTTVFQKCWKCPMNYNILKACINDDLTDDQKEACKLK